MGSAAPTIRVAARSRAAALAPVCRSPRPLPCIAPAPFSRASTARIAAPSTEGWPVFPRLTRWGRPACQRVTSVLRRSTAATPTPPSTEPARVPPSKGLLARARFGGAFNCESLKDFCNPTTGNCDPVNPAGGSCGVQTAVQCVGWQYCGTGSVCTPWPGPGDACTPGVTTCLLDLTCNPTSDTCTLPSAPDCGS